MFLFVSVCFFCFFFFQAEDGIRDFCLSRGLGDVYKRQVAAAAVSEASVAGAAASVVVDAALSVVVVSPEEFPHPVAIVATIVAARIKLITFFFISEKPPFLYS